MKQICSVIIPTNGKNKAYLKDALRSVVDQEIKQEQLEIIIVDNSIENSFDYQDMIRKLPPMDIKIIREPRNGLHYARHKGAEVAKGNLLFYIDDDVICPDGWIEAFLRSFDDPHVGCVGGKVVGKFETPPPSFVQDFTGYYSILDLGTIERDISFPKESLYGCNFGIRKDVLYEMGGFHPDGFTDPAYYWHRGDGETGLQRKILDSNWRMVYSPNAWLYHQIPSGRLTLAYLHKRIRNQAVSDGFTFYRAHNGKAVSIRDYLMCLLKEKRQLLIGSSGSQDRKFTSNIRAVYWKQRAEYAKMILRDSRMLEYVRSSQYWNIP